MSRTARKSRVGFEGKLKWQAAATNSPLPVVTPRAVLRSWSTVTHTCESKGYARGHSHGVYKRAFAWTDSTDPRTKPEAFASLLRGTPLITRIESRPAGDYTLRALSDDAVRVWVDNVLVIDDSTPHETRPAYATIGGGAPNIRVQYGQVDG